MATDMIDLEPAKQSKREYQKRGLGTMKRAMKHLGRRSIEVDWSDQQELVAPAWFE